MIIAKVLISFAVALMATVITAFTVAVGRDLVDEIREGNVVLLITLLFFVLVAGMVYVNL